MRGAGRATPQLEPWPLTRGWLSTSPAAVPLLAAPPQREACQGQQRSPRQHNFSLRNMHSPLSSCHVYPWLTVAS